MLGSVMFVKKTEKNLTEHGHFHHFEVKEFFSFGIGTLGLDHFRCHGDEWCFEHCPKVNILLFREIFYCDYFFTTACVKLDWCQFWFFFTFLSVISDRNVNIHSQHPDYFSWSQMPMQRHKTTINKTISHLTCYLFQPDNNQTNQTDQFFFFFYK